jgi:predicted ATP-dependent endonuclease of OLD family
LGIGEKFVSSNTFEKKDLHNLDLSNQIKIRTILDASYYLVWNDYRQKEESKTIAGEHQIFTSLEDGEIQAKVINSFFGANKHYNIFYVNFHNIKDEISTQRTSWGNLKSFLAKHIQLLVERDNAMKMKREAFENEVQQATNKVLENSQLTNFIAQIKTNYSANLRGNNCEVQFGLPNYEDIFLQMLFKIGLNGDSQNLIPINHFGDGYISMFIMAVIQAIAESNLEDKCLFLFEEPESFLHENHQEYFYKMVLCQLAERGHQVIYTTHSAKMLDIFDTKGIIRIEYDEATKQTLNKYNNVSEFNPSIDLASDETGEIITLEQFNSYVKSIEPNLNKIIFSRKVVLVEGPNDLMAYKFATARKVEKLFEKKSAYSEAYLNFLNISIIPHHGKATALLLIDLCKHLGLDYFVINDLDFETDLVKELSSFKTLAELKASNLYIKDADLDRSSTSKGMLTTNWNLISNAGITKIHFNIPKLEKVLGYDSNDKDSVKIWNRLNELQEFTLSFFPESLDSFLELEPKILHNDLEFKVKEIEKSFMETDTHFQDADNDLPF